MFGFRTKRNAKQAHRAIKKRSKELDRRHRESQERHEASMALHNKALSAERSGDLAKAAKIYILNLDRHSPMGLSHWERPAIVLERLGRLPEAIDICDRALALRIENQSTAKAFQDRFQKRKRRLMKKFAATK